MHNLAHTLLTQILSFLSINFQVSPMQFLSIARELAHCRRRRAEKKVARSRAALFTLETVTVRVHSITHFFATSRAHQTCVT